MKRLKSVLLGMVGTVALAAVFAMPAVTQAAVYCQVTQVSTTVNYDGVSPSSDLCKAMQYLVSKNVMTQFGGYGNGIQSNYLYGVDTSRGAGFTNRAQAAAVVLNAFDTSNPVNVSNTVYGSQLGFIDTPSYDSQWWYGYVLRAKQLGFISGYADGSIRGGNNVSRAEFVKMFLAASPKKYDVFNSNGLVPYFSDVSDYAWYAQYVKYVASYGNMIKAFQDSRCGGSNFCPDLPITQTEAALMMYYYSQIFGNIGTGSTPTPPSNYLATPYLSSPANATNYYYASFNGGSQNLVLNWGVTSGATKYDVIVNFYTVGQNGNNYNKTYTTTNTNYSVPSYDLPNVGTYGYDKISWKVRAYDANGNYKDSAQWYVMDNYGVQPNPPVSVAPVITSPTANAVFTNFPRQTYFSWTAASLPAGTVKYQLELGCNLCNGGVQYSNPLTYESNSTSMYQTMTGDDTYRFRARAVDIYGNMGTWSDYRYFSYQTAVQGLTAPVLTYPANAYTITGTNCDNANLNFTWNSVPGAIKYIWYFGNSSSAADDYNMDLSYSVNPDYFVNGTSNWYVRAYDVHGNYADSASRTIYVQQTTCSQLAAPVLWGPNNNSSYGGGTQGMTYSWNVAPGAVKYDIMIGFGAGPAYTTSYINWVTTTLNTNAVIYPLLTTNGSYYIVRWKVRAYDANGNYADSTEWTYRVYYQQI